MRQLARSFGLAIAPILDVFLAPLTLFSGLWFKYVRTVGLRIMRISRWVFITVGVLPIRDHYYEPKFIFGEETAFPKMRALPGVMLDSKIHFELLNRLSGNRSAVKFQRKKTEESQLQYYYENGQFGPGDADFLYGLVRYLRPKRVIEVGCGYSSLIIQEAIEGNNRESDGNFMEHVCIEPFENPWLSELNVKLIREKVEEVDTKIFDLLIKDDILFVDSSHVIRSDGDILKLILEVLPVLNPGVYVHFHDIFTPFDYPAEWLSEEIRLWNEQYLLEAFLSGNMEFEIVGALHWLYNCHKEFFENSFPMLREFRNNFNPKSFWIRKK
jgi:hypothetical protein